MRIFVNTLAILVFGGLIIGFIVQRSEEKTGNIIIGLSILAGAFVLMPSFLIYRSRGRKFKDYMLTQENIQKMKEKAKENNQ